MLKPINLKNKCGSCDHFRQIGDTAHGECLQNPYGEWVVHDPNYPYWIVTRSRSKCRLYNAKPKTNADRIRAMSDEELAEVLGKLVHCGGCPMRGNCKVDNLPCDNVLLEWLKQPAENQ